MKRLRSIVLVSVLMAISHTALAQMPYILDEDINVLVDGSSSWTLALSVEAGDQLFILAKGISSGWADADDWWRWFGPEGLLQDEGVPGGHPLPGYPGTCLIGKIGISGAPFYVGAFMAMEVPYDGDLYLGPNDYQPGDNPGDFRVFIWERSNPMTLILDPEPGSELQAGRSYPSPFSERTRMDFAVVSAGPVCVRVLDVGGRVVRTLLREDRPAGRFTAAWDGKDDSGRPVASGTYLIQVSAHGATETTRVVLLR